MKNIKVSKNCLDGMLTTAILETLGDLGILKEYSAFEEFRYEIDFKTKNNRRNGKLIALLLDRGTIINAYWVTDICRFNTQQQCIIKEIADKEELKNMLDIIYKDDYIARYGF